MTQSPLPQKPSRQSGIAHFFAAAGYSLQGLKRLSHESAFRQEAALGLVALVVLALCGASLAALAGMLALILLMVAIEALNTAIEVLVDHLSPEWSAFAKDAKDLGSLAVACAVGINVIYFLAVLFCITAYAAAA